MPLNLHEAPHEATAALDAALLNCPRPTHFGEYRFATPRQQEEIYKHLGTHYLTELEYKWLLFKIVEFNTEVADEVICQLARIIDYRRALGPLPTPPSRYYPEQLPKFEKLRTSRP
ncbi:hypothetical protein [Hymenobacter psoromatis]|uniref:hypothetical protein n=1 Tax=Hymenobacter psoromatis TaxID=1484116 RepID=UPI001CBE7C8E|nr:hypothetical protein [Hymenobacter psoromatis]